MATVRKSSPLGGSESRYEDDYLNGPPELVCEVASSSESYDLHVKRKDYERYGVLEYVIFIVRTQEVRWFIRDEAKFTEMLPAEDGTLRSQLFAGLWLAPAAFFAGDYMRLQAVLNQGLATPEHAALVERLRRPPA